MTRLLRPHIPLEVRCRVAARQLNNRFEIHPGAKGSLRIVLVEFLERLAAQLGCRPDDLHLDHDPALGAREKVYDENGDFVGYIPRANDPEHLVYRDKHSHQIKTNVRGEGAKHPDRVLIKKERRRNNPKQKRKTIWPKGRKLKGRSSWPAGRKIPKRRRR